MLDRNIEGATNSILDVGSRKALSLIAHALNLPVRDDGGGRVRNTIGREDLTAGITIRRGNLDLQRKLGKKVGVILQVHGRARSSNDNDAAVIEAVSVFSSELDEESGFHAVLKLTGATAVAAVEEEVDVLEEDDARAGGVSDVSLGNVAGGDAEELGNGLFDFVVLGHGSHHAVHVDDEEGPVQSGCNGLGEMELSAAGWTVEEDAGRAGGLTLAAVEAGELDGEEHVPLERLLGCLEAEDLIPRDILQLVGDRVPVLIPPSAIAPYFSHL